MMITPEELNAMNANFSTLTEDDLSMVSGGNADSYVDCISIAISNLTTSSVHIPGDVLPQLVSVTHMPKKGEAANTKRRINMIIDALSPYNENDVVAQTIKTLEHAISLLGN